MTTGALQRPGAVLDRQAKAGTLRSPSPTARGRRRLTHSGSTSRRSAGTVGASASPRRPRSSPPAVVRAGHGCLTHARLHGRAGRPARGAPYPGDTDRLRQRPRDRGPPHSLFPRPPIHKRKPAAIAPTEMRRTLTLIDPRHRHAMRRARYPPFHLRPCSGFTGNHLIRFAPTFLAVSTGASRRRIPCLVVFLWIRSRSTWSA